MESKRRIFSNLNLEGWKNLLCFGIVCFYIIAYSPSIINGAIGNDYLAFWSTGYIADRKGYSEIYNLAELKQVQQLIVYGSGEQAYENNPSFYPSPVPYFSVFVIPFQLLSRISIKSGYQFWTILNLLILIGYLFFFLHRTIPETEIPGIQLLIPFLICYAVIFNSTCGQVEVFVLISTGEFMRQSLNKKPILSGLWLGGLLLKPQLLILIVPIFIFLRYWKVILGFLFSSLIIMGTSFILSGFDGMNALFNLWTKFSGGIATSAPYMMINWRMVGVNLNELFHTHLGWVIAVLGILLTLVAVYKLVKHMPPMGSPLWVVIILGVFSATLSITWHSHYHMAMVLIPFLVYALIYKLLPERKILSWCLITPLAFLGSFLLETFFFFFSGRNPTNFHVKILAFTGLLLNMVLLLTVLRVVRLQEQKNSIPGKNSSILGIGY